MINPNIRRFALGDTGVIVEVLVLDPRDVAPCVEIGFVVGKEITSSVLYSERYLEDREIALKLFPNGWTPCDDVDLESSVEVNV